MTRRLLVFTVLAIALGFATSATVATSTVNRSHDVVVTRALIPSAKNVHGELRWIERDGTTCLQTLLYTPSLRRGVDAMRKKELKAWPSGSSGYADSSRYLAMLEAASRESLRRFDARTDPAVTLQTMAIEFSISGNEATFATFMLEIEKHHGDVVIKSIEPFAMSSGSREYVAQAMRLQAAAAFGSVPKDLDAAVGKDH